MIPDSGDLFWIPDLIMDSKDSFLIIELKSGIKWVKKDSILDNSWLKESKNLWFYLYNINVKIMYLKKSIFDFVN